MASNTNKFKPKLGFLLVLVIVVLSIPAMYESNNLSPRATAQLVTSTLTVTTQDTSGNTLTGLFVSISQNGAIVASGFSPVTFTLNDGVQYTLEADGYASHVFDHWLDSGSTSNTRTVSITS